jgi:hypothetical protein
MQAAALQYRDLFDRYVTDQTEAKQCAEQWWNGVVDNVARRAHKSRTAALGEARAGNPTAPASHSAVIAVLRAYWLQCAALNESVAPEDRVPPEQLVLGWLLESGHADLAELLGWLTYLPVGLDQTGHWV